MAFIRQDQADITVAVDQTPYPSDNSPWHSFEGGDLEASDGKARPGGMGYEVSLGGPASRNDVTLSRPLDDVIVGHHSVLEKAAIQAAPVTVTVVYLDRTGTTRPNVPTFVVNGTLKSAKLPSVDSESGDPGMYELVVCCDEEAA